MTQNGETKWIVLVLGDEIVRRVLLTFDLEEAGFRVISALTPVEAFSVLEHRGSMVDLIVVDLQLPQEEEGHALALTVRRLHPTVPTIVVSDLPPPLSPEVDVFVRRPGFSRDIITAARRLLAKRTKAPPHEPDVGSA